MNMLNMDPNLPPTLDPPAIVILLILIIGSIPLIISICLLIKAIIDTKKINNNFSQKAISSIKITSIILLALNSLTILWHYTRIFSLVTSIISTIFIFNAQKLIAIDEKQAKNKANVASILNIVCISIWLGIPIMSILNLF